MPDVVPAQRWLGQSLRRLFASPKLTVALFAVPAGVILAGVVSWLIDWRLGVDSAVYRSGAVALLTGEPLYDNDFLSAEPPWARLPFTYPPTGALLFVPLALFATQVSWGVLGALSVLSLALVVRVAIQVLPTRPTWLRPARTTVLVTVLALGLEPVWRTLFLGQINLILMALVVVDVLVLGRSRHFGGVLVGVAAAVKLTPLIFVPHLWLVGRRADAVRALATFALLQALIFVIIPHDFRQFWSVAVTDPERTGPTFWAGNQSLNGLMLRLTDLAPWALAAAICVGALLAVPAVYLVRRFHRAGQPLPALLVYRVLRAAAQPGHLVAPLRVGRPAGRAAAVPPARPAPGRRGPGPHAVRPRRGRPRLRELRAVDHAQLRPEPAGRREAGAGVDAAGGRARQRVPAGPTRGGRPGADQGAAALNRIRSDAVFPRRVLGAGALRALLSPASARSFAPLPRR